MKPGVCLLISKITITCLPQLSLIQLVPCYHGYTVDTLSQLSHLDDSDLTVRDRKEASGMVKYCDNHPGKWALGKSSLEHIASVLYHCQATTYTHKPLREWLPGAAWSIPEAFIPTCEEVCKGWWLPLGISISCWLLRLSPSIPLFTPKCSGSGLWFNLVLRPIYKSNGSGRKAVCSCTGRLSSWCNIPQIWTQVQMYVKDFAADWRVGHGNLMVKEQELWLQN